jgi:hypothetical protein
MGAEWAQIRSGHDEIYLAFSVSRRRLVGAHRLSKEPDAVIFVVEVTVLLKPQTSYTFLSLSIASHLLVVFI